MSNGATGGQASATIPRMSKGYANFRRHNVLADAIEGQHVSTIGNVPQRRNNFPTIAQISGNTADDDTNRFFYGYVEVYLSGRGYDKWKQVQNGAAGDPDNEKTRIYHYVEDVNTKDGFTGSGINAGNLPKNSDGTPAFEIKPVPDGTLVAIDFYDVNDGDDKGVVGWFYVLGTQGADGQCPTDDTSGGTP